MNFNQVWALHVTSTSILTGTQGGYVDEFNEFTAANRNTAWQQTMGGPRVRRWDGVKQALNAIVNDTTLTTGLTLVLVTGMLVNDQAEMLQEVELIVIEILIVVTMEAGLENIQMVLAQYVTLMPA